MHTNPMLAAAAGPVVATEAMSCRRGLTASAACGGAVKLF
jgi:hypothetical protein